MLLWQGGKFPLIRKIIVVTSTTTLRQENIIIIKKKFRMYNWEIRWRGTLIYNSKKKS